MTLSPPVRYSIWLGCFLAVLTVFLQVRLEVHQLRKSIDRTGSAIDAASSLHQQLTLELDARSRFVETQRHADQLGLTNEVTIVEASREPRGR
ncbi:MAG: hypothetical protein AAF602_01685 [Myxococcota bacterium]